MYANLPLNSLPILYVVELRDSLQAFLGIGSGCSGGQVSYPRYSRKFTFALQVTRFDEHLLLTRETHFNTIGLVVLFL